MRAPVRGRIFLTAIKGAAGLPGPQMVLRVGQMATLRPVATRRIVQNPNDVRCLSEWRNKFMSAFLTEFVATEQRTATWLENVVGCDDGRILFMVDNADALTVGYMGLAFIDWDKGYGEADAVVRGLDNSPALMRAALQTLLQWAQGQLELTRIGVRVRSDNVALTFYRKIGFVETRRVPLVAMKGAEGTVTWHESTDDRSSNVSLIYHDLDVGNSSKVDAAPSVSGAPAK